MSSLSALVKRWKKFRLPVVFYHTTFAQNVRQIMQDQRIIANRGESICKERNGLVSLSDHMTKGIVEFFGNVVLEFDAAAIYAKNPLTAPKHYGSSSDIAKYDDVPLFENEWVAPKEIRFDLEDINRVLLITSRNCREPEFEDVVRVLRSNAIEFCFLSERWLSDKMVTDMTSYLYRLRGWRRFKKARADV